jgi:hypothetical protein
MKRGIEMAARKQLMSVIGRESKICDLAIQQLKDKCKIFEEKYRMSSKDFYDLFQKGKMGDSQDAFEWKALIEGIQEWQQTKEEIKELEELTS